MALSMKSAPPAEVVRAPRETESTVFPSWNGRTAFGAANVEAAQFQQVWFELAGAPIDDKLAFAADTRRVHRRLLAPSVPAGYEEYAGYYRGADFPALEKRTATIRYERPYFGPSQVVRFANPLDVANEMEILASRIFALKDKPLEPIEYFFQIVSIFRRFNVIHPYLNGNGRMARLLLAVLASARGIPVSEHWTFHLRPYDGFIGFCFDEYGENPHLLTAYLTRWFG
jgi:hypothetical protein